MNNRTLAWASGILLLAVAFGAFGVSDLLGKLISWTNPKGPMPRFRDRVK